MRILVAEDDVDAANMYKIILESKGHRVIIAEDGGKCVETYGNANEPFDAVLLDYSLPVLSGLQAAKEIIKINQNQRIIFASTSPRQTLAESVKDLKQVVEILEKPFEPDVLVTAIEDRSAVTKLKKVNAIASQNYKEVDNLLQMLKEIQSAGTI